MPASLKALCGNVVMRGIRGGDYDETDALDGEHLVEAADDPDVRVAALRLISTTFEDGRKHQAGEGTNHGRVKNAAGESESDEANLDVLSVGHDRQ